MSETVTVTMPNGHSVTMRRNDHGEWEGVKTGNGTSSTFEDALLDALAARERELAEAQRENTALRSLAQKVQCPHGMQQGGACQLGFPGCACADDSAVYFDTYGDGMAERRERALRQARADLAAVEADNARLRGALRDIVSFDDDDRSIGERSSLLYDARCIAQRALLAREADDAK